MIHRTLKNSESGYFFSGSVTLSPGQIKSFDLDSLSGVQLLDILEAVDLKKLEVEELQDIKDKYKTFSGKSAYASAIQEGFVGSQKEWLESLQGSPNSPSSIQSFKDAYNKLD